MKRLIISTLLTLGVTGSALAYHLPAAYRAVYCYPTGSYWAAQIAAFPDYYAAHNSYYLHFYGPGSRYC